MLVAVAVFEGDMEEARGQMENLLKLFPGANADWARRERAGFQNLDFTSMLVAWLVAALGIYAVTYINYGSGPTLAATAWVGLIEMLMVLIQFYQFGLLIVVIASFLAQGSYHPALALLHQLIEPLLGPIRKILPSLGPLDLSPMVLFLIIIVVQNLLAQSMPRGL